MNNSLQINLPVKKLVTVDITSDMSGAHDAAYLQQTLITWPDGTHSTFETPKPATTGKTVYGHMQYQTGSTASQASVEVFEASAANPNRWAPTFTRITADRKGVESDGHQMSPNQDWDDTVVTFSWS